MSDSNQSVISVKEFVGILNETLNFAFPLVTVEGEVHSFKINQNKWVFFDLKDEEATLSCFMPVYALKVPLEDGMKVRAAGSPKLTNWGKFSFTVKTIELAGEGELRRAFELLKGRLSDEGLFDALRKRPLPIYPHRIGLITSATSAAYADFVKVLTARWGGLTVEVADVQVQGAPAPGQIVSAILYFNQLAQPVDALVLVRGGGSLEDLQAFNTEEVARAVAGSRTPIVVGVGHEVDVSLADFAADLRAATPTDAARLVVPDRLQVMQTVDHQGSVLVRAVERQMQGVLHKINFNVDVLAKFLSGPRDHIADQVASLRREFDRFQLRIETYNKTVVSLSSLMSSRQISQLEKVKSQVATLSRVLEGFSPQATLNRGYAILRQEGNVIKSVNQVSRGDLLMIQLADGKIGSRVEDKER